MAALDEGSTIVRRDLWQYHDDVGLLAGQDMPPEMPRLGESRESYQLRMRDRNIPPKLADTLYTYYTRKS